MIGLEDDLRVRKSKKKMCAAEGRVRRKREKEGRR